MEAQTNLISYSLYGNEPRYTEPLLQDAQQVGDIFPGWRIVVYHDNTVDNAIVTQLETRGVETINIRSTKYHKLPPKIWRFLPVKDDDADCVIFRDSDSTLTSREYALVMSWCRSDKLVHIIRDHPLHIAPILAGMFGIKRAAFPLLADLLDERTFDLRGRPHDYDQVFLADHFYPRVAETALIHTAFFQYYRECVEKIVPVPEGYNYVGAVYEETDLKREQNRLLIVKGKFTKGIPYGVSRIFRYRVRPVLYSSKLVNSVANIIKFLKAKQ